MTTGYVVTHGRYDEQIIPGKRLGRQQLTDSRSAAYPFQVTGSAAISDVDWPRHAPIFDQGDIGSCEGNAEVGTVACTPLYEALPARHLALSEPLALRVYATATGLDGYPGTFTYPPPGGDDTGTDSTSASKAAAKLGLISGYLHAAGLPATLAALMTGPVNLAFDWYSSFDDPDPVTGLIGIAPGAEIRGGHALCARGVDVARRLVWCDNSWGPGWGQAGRFCLAWTTLEDLLVSGGECVVPLPLSVPPPQPVPVPDPLAAYLADPRLINWAGRGHTGDNAYAARQYTWLRTQVKTGR